MIDKYVNANELMKTIKSAAECCDTLGRHKDAEAYRAVAKTIDGYPAADVVRVVRCRDCDHKGDNTIGKECVFCKHLETVVPLAHFCGYGVRMDGGDFHVD